MQWHSQDQGPPSRRESQGAVHSTTVPLGNAVCTSCPFPKCSSNQMITFFSPQVPLDLWINASSLISRVQAQICPHAADTFLVSRIWRRNIRHKPGRRRIASVATKKRCQASWWRSQGARRSPSWQRGQHASRRWQRRGPAHHRPSDPQVGRLWASTRAAF